MSNIGIMDPAFFVGKNVLLAWLNDFFQAGYTKVEQMANGAMACQILDAIYPGKVPLGKVNFDAKTQPESVANFKVLQGVFDRESITKYVDVSKLLNGKFQDNLEFLQWLKSFFDKNYSGQEYNAAERRETARQQYKKGHKFAGSSTSAIKSNYANAPATRPAASSVTKPAAAAGAVSKVAAKPAAPVGTRAASGTIGAKRASPPGSARGQGNTAEVAELSAQVRELTTAMEGLEKERGFYFGKLREIEILLQDDSTAQSSIEQVKQAVLDILYKTDDASEFQAPEGTEEVAVADEAGDQGLLDDAELSADNTF